MPTILKKFWPKPGAWLPERHAAVESIYSSQSMENVKSIEKAVESLPPSELAEFRRWFAEFDAQSWDCQIEQDAYSGKLDSLTAKALADYRSGPAREL